MNGGVRNDTIWSIKKYSFIQLMALIFVYCTCISIFRGGTWNILISSYRMCRVLPDFSDIAKVWGYFKAIKLSWIMNRQRCNLSFLVPT